MSAGDKLVKQELISKTTEIIDNLTQNISDVRCVNSSLLNAVNEAFIAGYLGDTIVAHLSDLMDLNNAYVWILEQDVEDCNRLISDLETYVQDCDETLDVDVIMEGITSFENLVAETEASISYLESEYNSLSMAGRAAGFFDYHSSRRRMTRERNNYQNQLEDFQRQRNLFYAIEVMTSSLFTYDSDIRQAIYDGYSQISSEWNDDNTCTVDSNCSWRNTVYSFRDEQIEARTASYYDENGNINWERVDETLSKPADEVHYYDYVALTRLYSGMTEDELETLFNDYASDGENIGGESCWLRPTFVTSVNCYQVLSLADARDCNMVFTRERSDISRDYTRSTLMRVMCDEITAHQDQADSIFCVQEFSAELGDGEVVLSESATIQYSSAYGGGILRRDEIVVSSYEHGGLSDCSSQAIEDVLDEMAGTTEGSLIECLDGSIQSLIDEIADTHFGMLSLFDPLIEHWINAENVETYHNLSTDSMVFSAIPSGGQLVVINRDNCWTPLDPADSYQVRDVTINQTQLQQRLDLYNGLYDPDISVEDISSGLNRYINGEIDTTLLEDSSIYSDDPFVTYVRWWVTDGEAEMLDANGDDISSLGEG